MKIVIPMSGRGDRFRKAGYSTLKPLIEVDGKTMVEHVVESFPGEENFLFICNESDLEDGSLDKLFKKIAPKSKVRAMPSHKKGPVFTVAHAFDDIADDEPVIVNYCDFNQQWDYRAFKKAIEGSDYDGAIPSYTGFHPHLLHKKLYAGILTDAKGDMLEIQEKHCFTENPEDSFHSSGTYYFKSGALMKRYFRELMDKDVNLNGEYYVSMAYYFFKRDGLKVAVPKLEHFMQWGTPEDLEEYEAWSRLVHADHKKPKKKTDIPPEREAFVKIPHHSASEEFKRSYTYWKEYFKKIW